MYTFTDEWTLYMYDKNERNGLGRNIFHARKTKRKTNRPTVKKISKNMFAYNVNAT